MRKQKSYILPPLESKKLLAIDRQVQKDIKEQHHALECVRSEMSLIVALKYQSQIKSFQHSRTANRPRASQSLYEPIPQQQIEHQQTGINFLGTVKRRFLKSHIEPQSVELLKFYEEEDYYELREYFKQHPIDQFIQGITLLYRAVKDENLKMIQFCLSRGADMNLIQEKWPYRRMTPYLLAKQMNNQEVIHLMHI